MHTDSLPTLSPHPFITTHLSSAAEALETDTHGALLRPAPPLPPEAAISAAIEASLQEAASDRPAAVSPTAPPAAPGPPPTLRDVRPADLGDVGRLLVLWAQAQERGWLSSSEADRLHVVAAAVHARRIGEAPCRLFVALLRDRRWEVITQADEDTARAWLRTFRDGPAPRAAPAPVAPLLTPLVPRSEDADVVALQRGLPPAWRDRPLLFLKLQDPTWTLARWEHAQAELTQWRLLQAQANARSQRASLGAILDREVPWEDAGDAE